jgi:hypothetical protein
MPRPRLVSPDILEAALVGLETQRQKIDEHITRIRSVMAVRAIRNVAGRAAPIVGHAAGAQTRKKRVLSPEARQRIADAQKKRWAAVRKAAKKAK